MRTKRGRANNLRHESLWRLSRATGPYSAMMSDTLVRSAPPDAVATASAKAFAVAT